MYKQFSSLSMQLRFLTCMLVLGFPNMSQANSHIQAVRETARYANSGSSEDVQKYVSTIMGAFISEGPLKEVIDNRLAKLQLQYMAGDLPPVDESTLVKALNHIGDQIGLPDYGKTSPLEFRLLRVSVLQNIPELNSKVFVETEQHTTVGGKLVKTISSAMTPAEIAYLVCSLTIQKRFNPHYQQTEAELKRKFAVYQQKQAAVETAKQVQHDSPDAHVIGEIAHDSERAITIETKIRSFIKKTSSTGELTNMLDSFLKEIGYEK